jgi:hypothetical protein
MQISNATSSSGISGNINFDIGTRATAEPTSDADAGKELNFIYRELIMLRRSLEEIENPLRMRPTGTFRPPGPASTASSSDIGFSEPTDLDDPMTSVSELSAVLSGDISINGTVITINVLADSLNDVIGRINSSGAAVTASLDANEQRVSIVSDNTTDNLVISSGTTGFFTALNISDSTYEPVRQIGTSDMKKTAMSNTKVRSIADSIKRAAEAFSNIFDEKKTGSSSDSDIEEFIDTIRGDFKSVILAAFDSGSNTLNTDFGIKFDFSSAAARVFDFSSVEQNKLFDYLLEGDQSVNDLLFGKRSKHDDGLVEKMLDFLESTEEVLKDILGTTGVLVDVLA